VVSVRCILLLYLMQGIQAGESLCSEQHFCSCPPFLRHHSTSGDPSLYWGKPNYGDQYAIVGKSKELHCCVLPGYASLEWFKDEGEYPWHSAQGRNTILYSNNQSLLIMEVSPTDSGKYKCVAQSPTGQVLQHTTILTSFPAPVFSHTPIWNKRPASTTVSRGSKAVLECSATVGQQYNTVSTEPVQAAWTRFGREIEDGPHTMVHKEWTEDDIVITLRLEINSAEEKDKGEYSCKVRNQYGVLEEKVVLEVEENMGEDNEEEKTLKMKRELHGILKKQMKIYSALSRIATVNQDIFQETLREAEKKFNSK